MHGGEKRGLATLAGVVLLLAATCASSLASPTGQAGSGPPQRFAAADLAGGLANGGGKVRVTIVVRGGLGLPDAAATRRGALAPAPDAGERFALRHAPRRTTLAYARRQDRRRAGAVRSLRPAARTAVRSQRDVQRAIVRLGGRLLSGSTLANTVTASVPRRSLARLAARSDVQAITPAPAPKPLDDIASAASASGAPTWWAAGHTGGGGAADVPANLSVVQDPVYRGHPAFAGLAFESVPGEPAPAASFSLTGHGTALLSVAAAQGPTGCPLCQPGDERQKGTAFGVNKVLDPDGAYSEFDWPIGVTYGRWDSAARIWRYQDGATDPAQVLTYSRGADVEFDDDVEAQDWDMMVDGYGVTAAVAAGNSGPAPRTVNNPALAYNVIGVGAYCCSSSPDHTTDAVWTWSSRGPTVAGRKKPDLVAPGDGDLADVLYNTTGSLWKYQTGTSFAAPHVAAAAILLAGAGIRDPKVVKAILIDSARQGRAGPGQPWGSQTGWQPDFGWGELDLDAAYRERLNFVRGSVPPNGARFFRATAQAAGDRATLVWNRRVTDCAKPRQGCTNSASSGWHVYTLSNLDLAAYSAASGTRESASESAIDNVEQVRTTAAGGVIYKVSAGGVDTLAGEPFALAATRPLTPLATPQPTVALETSATAPVGPGDEVTVTATVSNPSPDLAAPAAQVTLALPPGVELVDGDAATQALGTLARKGTPGATATASWTIRGATGGPKQLAAPATASVYGTTLTGTDATTIEIDATGPLLTLAAPSGTRSSPDLALAWSGDDPAGVASFDVEVSLNGGPWTRWLTATNNTTAAYRGTAGNGYRFRVRARDALGNTSVFVTSGPTTIARPVRPVRPAPQPPAPRDAGLALTTARRTPRTLKLSGTLDRAATGRLTARWSARSGRRRFSARAATHVRAGAFSMKLAIPRRARHIKRSSLTLRYGGDAAFAPERLRVRLATR